MRQSRLFGKTLRDNPKDEIAANAKLLERGGFVYKTMAGVYDYLPLGVRVLQKIVGIIRSEMNAIGGQEALFTSLQPKERWERTGRWEELGREVMYQFKDHSGRELGLAATHEESVTEIAERSVFSYKDLPVLVYQIQNKFRDELRAKSGLIRGREFLMKDLYSFHASEEDLNRFYGGSIDRAYRKIFKRCGLEVYVAEASGGSFTKEFTHEYQVLSEAGEDLIFGCSACRYAQNQEISKLRGGDQCPRCRKGVIKAAKSVEVGNIFKLGTRYAKDLELYFRDRHGERQLVFMGSYGIGLGRVLATVVEVHHDEYGIVWPESISPFKVHLLALVSGPGKRTQVRKTAEKLYLDFLAKGVEVLYDDRGDKTAGEKFADADLLGIPWRVVVSDKTLKKRGVEIKRRGAKDLRVVSPTAFLKEIL